MAYFDNHKNLAYTTVATAPSPASSGTSLVVAAGTGSTLGTAPFNMTVWPINTQPTQANAEIVRVTNIATDTLTITRTQESTSARTILVGDQIAVTVTALNLTNIEGATSVGAVGYVATGQGVSSAIQLQARDNSICDVRLTGTTVTPVTSGDVTSITSIFMTPYRGNRIALYDGSAGWNVRTFSEITIALGTLTGSIGYDVFAYDNAGTVTCEVLAWTSATARATALALQDGVLVKSGATTRRYVGSFFTTSTTTTTDSAAKRHLWNYYNRVDRTLAAAYGDASWTYNTATIRQANANAANQVEAFTGYAETIVEIGLQLAAGNGTAGTIVTIGVGVDSTTTFSDSPGGVQIQVSNNPIQITARYRAFPSVGRHIYSANEYVSVAGGNTTFYSSGTVTNAIGSITGRTQG